VTMAGAVAVVRISGVKSSQSDKGGW
jgi:hypothetical protein